MITRTPFQIALILALAATAESSLAACLPNIDAAKNCRFEQGDAWCAEHGQGNRFAFHDNCLQDTHSPTTSEATLPNDKRWIIVASRPTIEEAKAIAASYKAEFINAAVFSSKNRQYAVTIGDEPYPNAKKVLAELIAAQKIPADSFLATGHDLYRISVSESKPSVALFFHTWDGEWGDGEKYIRYITPFGIAQSGGSIKQIDSFSAMMRSTDGSMHHGNAKLVTVGQPVYLYSDGNLLGSTTISRININQEAGQCSNEVVDGIELSNPQLFPKGRKGIVSTAQLPMRQTRPKHELTADEKTAANNVVAELMTQEGFASGFIEDHKKRLTITPVKFRDQNGDALVISVNDEESSEQPNKPVYYVFLVAERSSAGKWELTYRYFTKVSFESNGIPNEDSYSFADHLDLDGDGADELILNSVGGYAVLQRYEYSNFDKTLQYGWEKKFQGDWGFGVCD